MIEQLSNSFLLQISLLRNDIFSLTLVSNLFNSLRLFHIKTALTFQIGGDANRPDWKLVKEFLLKEGRFTKEHVVLMAKTCIDIMSKPIKLICVRKGT